MFGVEFIQFLSRNGSFVNWFIIKTVDKRYGRNADKGGLGYILVKVKFNFTGYWEWLGPKKVALDALLAFAGRRS